LQGYRVYVIGPDGHLIGRHDLYCDNDEIAKKRAEALVYDHDLELWCGERKVATFRAKPAEPQ
jgi:hypothetical protein